jgi:hypothetical protein
VRFHSAQQADLKMYFRDARRLVAERLFAHNAQNAGGKSRFMHF